jgi:GTP-binding protein HflX
LKELARSCGVEVFDKLIQHRSAPDPRFLLGKGRLSQLVIRAMQIGANLLIFDHELTPAQARSLADFTELKVIDRTQLILDIFARRAHSREGKIQVELAQLKYALPRLPTRDTALSRLTGGIGARGPGETKLEISRRRVRDRIHLLEKQTRLIEKSRGRQRVKREKTAIPIISIVGYTNAGKSTLLNAMTKSAVFTEDRLFATLDPKSSRLRFPRDAEAIITDTVGFIRDLPPDLFAAFRATLDELKEADLLLHLVDVSNPYFESQIEAVDKILQELEIAGKPTLLVFNKEDRLPDKSPLTDLCRRFGAVAISALNPASLSPLMEKLEDMVLNRATPCHSREEAVS